MKRDYLKFKQLIFLFVIILLSSCNRGFVKNSEKLVVDTSKDSIFTVRKIDSINDYYIVYLKKADDWFKVVSKKDSSGDSRNKIEIEKSYFFNLYSLWNEKLIINGIDVSLSKTPNVQCIGFDEKTSICLERDSINDLFIAKNLKGLKVTR
ncbi:hypothetical protein [Flavobacterium sp.]|uniref:hypothetical protein n=1 Tax=Flavobacterium sp. TaxID=239 RepID=UPI002FD958BF